MLHAIIFGIKSVGFALHVPCNSVMKGIIIDFAL